ncbi:hypothetical protein [Amycolatopsis sp. NPDC021455]|uniref:hypothetical protein n=1 Tax=Amycolatopsis sp. NPDC021455 TaxID=3154901 RepID=UPI0034111109
MSEPLDLFGNELTATVPVETGRPPVNDMDLIEKVLAVAENTGYVLVGSAERVYRLVANKTIETAPMVEADAVHQLLDSKWLTKGGTHIYTCHGHSGPGNSVLVPKATRLKARKWRSLAARPTTPNQRKVS